VNILRLTAVLIVVASGFLGLALVGTPCAVAAGLGLAAALGSPLLKYGAGRVPWPLLTLSVVVLLGLAVVWGVPAAQALGVLLAYLQVHNRLGRLGESDDRTAVVLAALMLAIGASVTSDPVFGLAIAGFGLALPVALSRGPLGLRHAAGLSLTGAALAGVLFVAAPRARLTRDRVELTGFAPEVELGALDELFDDPSVVFRAAVRPIPQEVIYWRGLALDTFDGSRWTSGSPLVPVTIQPGDVPQGALIIEVEPMEPGPVFTAGLPLDLKAPVPLLADGQGGFALRGEPVRYRLVVQGPLGRRQSPYTPPEDEASTALQRALALPGDLDPRIVQLAASRAGEGTAAQKMERLAQLLRSEYSYTRRPRDAGDESPLSLFLFERRAGHCEYFATALAILARTQGIPARVVNGFVGGTLEPETGWWTVRRKDAHTWVEYHDGGWVIADPTPGPASVALPPGPARSPPWTEQAAALWDEGVLGYDRDDQLDALIRAARSAEEWLVHRDTPSLPWRGLLVLGLISFVTALGTRALLRFLVRRLLDPPRSEPVGPVARAHHRARTHLAEQGLHVPPALPPVEAARWLAAKHPSDATTALVQLAWLYYSVHLGGEDAGAKGPEARALLERVRALKRA
jgi:transglutaminase-like putative cysteine protease